MHLLALLVFQNLNFSFIKPRYLKIITHKSNIIPVRLAINILQLSYPKAIRVFFYGYLLSSDAHSCNLMTFLHYWRI